MRGYSQNEVVTNNWYGRIRSFNVWDRVLDRHEINLIYTKSEDFNLYKECFGSHEHDFTLPNRIVDQKVWKYHIYDDSEVSTGTGLRNGGWGQFDLKNYFTNLLEDVPTGRYVCLRPLTWNNDIFGPGVRFDVYVSGVLHETPDLMRYFGSAHGGRWGTGKLGGANHSSRTDSNVGATQVNSNGDRWSGWLPEHALGTMVADRNGNRNSSTAEYIVLDLGEIKEVTGIKVLERAFSSNYLKTFDIYVSTLFQSLIHI